MLVLVAGCWWRVSCVIQIGGGGVEEDMEIGRQLSSKLDTYYSRD